MVLPGARRLLTATMFENLLASPNASMGLRLAPFCLLRLNAAVSRIERTDSGAIITHAADDGSAPTATTTTADVAIVSLPLGVLKAGRVEFIPPLPSEKREAIEHLGVGLLNKVFVWFEQVNNRHFLRFFDTFVVTLPPS